jgi:hypothetical protein
MADTKYVQDQRGNEVEVITRQFTRYPNPFPKRGANRRGGETSAPATRDAEENTNGIR